MHAMGRMAVMTFFLYDGSTLFPWGYFWGWKGREGSEQLLLLLDCSLQSHLFY